VFVSQKGHEVQGLAITKNGSHAKLCHISVLPTARGRGLGGTLMWLAIADMTRRGATEIHVTTGEEVFGNHAKYFSGFGFSLVDWHLNRYRKGNSELVWKKNVGYEPLSFEQSVEELDNIPRFYCEADPFSFGVSRFGALRTAIDRWYSTYMPNAPDESIGDNLWSACNARQYLRWSRDCSPNLRLVPSWKPSPARFGNDTSTFSQLFWRTNSCAKASLSKIAEAKADRPLLDDHGKSTCGII